MQPLGAVANKTRKGGIEKMKNKINHLLLVLILITTGFITFRCGDDKNKNSRDSRTEDSAYADSTPSINPADYFPMDIGTKWVYQIEVKDVDPLFYRAISGETSEGIKTMESRGSLVSAKRAKKQYELAMRIKSVVKLPQQYQYPIGLLIEIENDELDLYEYHSRVFWAIKKSPMFIVLEIVSFLPNSPGGPIRYMGFSDRVSYFYHTIGVGLSMGPQKNIYFENKGLDSNVPQFVGTKCMHFIKRVMKDDRMNELNVSHTNKEFTEETWFAKGKGLVRLVQKVDGKVSMIWTLADFIQK